MLCYDIRVRFMEPGTPFGKTKDDKDKEPELEEKLQKLNAGVYALTSEDDFYAVVYRADDDFLDFAVAAWPNKITVSKVKKKLEWAVNSTYGGMGTKAAAASEITAKKFTMMLEESDNREYIKRSTRRTERDLEASCNIMIVFLAALLHDADDHKLFDCGLKLNPFESEEIITGHKG